MASPGLVILAIFAIGALLVLLPVALAASSRARATRVVVCPETGGPASVALDPGRAARGAIFGKTWLAVENCSRWPERAGCDQACIAPASEAAGGS